jgi:protein gp37
MCGYVLAVLHMWFGVSVEDGTKLSRVRHLQETPARIRFLSIEPMIGPIGQFDLRGIDWVIVGGESGPQARPMRREWVCTIRDQCAYVKHIFLERYLEALVLSDVAFFFKQWGGLRPKSGGRKLDGREWNQFPRGAASFAVAAE